MGDHIIEGEFQSDKYPTTPRGKVPLSVKDPLAQPFLWAYAQLRRPVDAGFAEDLETVLLAAGYLPTPSHEGSLASSLVIAKGEIGCLVLALERIKAKALVTSTEPSDMLEAIERLGAIGAEVVAAFQARAGVAKAYEGHRP
jgi:hypothetical protein